MNMMIFQTEKHLHNDYPGINDTLYRQVTIAYKNNNIQSRNLRLMIEFLFHYMHSVGVIKAVTFEGGIEYYGSQISANLTVN